MTARGNVLVTGGAGFIGAHLARRCLEAGRRVWVVDDLSTGAEKNVPRGTEFLRLDLSTDSLAEKLPRENFEAVLHLAAQSSGEISSEDPVRDLRVNALATVALLDWASRRAKRFLYASSMAVYGDPARLPVREDDLALPLSPYGIGKLASEHYVRRYHRPGFSTMSFRMFSVYGPGQNMSNMKQGIVSIFMAYVLAKRPVVVKGSLDRFRDLIYIDDVADAWMAALENPAAAGRIYNLAGGRKITVREIVEEILKAAGETPGVYPVEAGPPTPADQFGVMADISRVSAELKWAPRVGLAEGLKKMTAWARAA